MLQDYLVCRPNVTERLDFYSLNSYEWCGQSTFQTSGYVALQNAAENYPVPIFFSEDGVCHCKLQRRTTVTDLHSVTRKVQEISLTKLRFLAMRWQELGQVRSFTNGFKRPTTMDSSHMALNKMRLSTKAAV